MSVVPGGCRIEVVDRTEQAAVVRKLAAGHKAEHQEEQAGTVHTWDPLRRENTLVNTDRIKFLIVSGICQSG